VDFVWSWAEPSQNSFSWGIYDAIAAAAQARDLRVFATIGNTPAWATSGTQGIGVPTNPADFYDICYRAAQRYDGNHGQSKIEYWGMWNEANLDGFWEGTRQQYIDIILKNGADAIHAGNPNAKACGPEMAHLTSGDQDWYAWLRDCIQQSAGKLEVVTHHTYCSDGYANCRDKLNASTMFGNNPSLWDLVKPSVREVLEYVNWTGPVWLTETGWESAGSGEQSQANNYTGLLNDWFTGQTGRTWIERVFFYELNDATAFPDLSWGILGPDPTFPRKLAFYAYQSFTAAHPPPLCPPEKATDPSPGNGATQVDLLADLSWTAGERATSHKVCFGTSSPPPLRQNQTATTYDPGTLAANTHYFWRIDEVNDGGATTGDLWSFWTGSYPGDFDSDGDVDLSDYAALQACLDTYASQPGCADTDMNEDAVTNQADVAVFLRCLSGPNIQGDAHCAAGSL